MSPSPLRSTFGRPKRFRETASFRFMVLYPGGRPPYYARARFRFSFRGGQHDPWRLLSRPVVQSSLSKSRLFFPIKSSLMVPGLSMLPYLGYRATGRQTAPTRTSAESVGVKTGHFARNCTFHGPAGDSADFPPLASSSQCADASVYRDSSDSQFLKDNEVDLLQSQSILQDLVPVSGDSSDAESIQKSSKRVGEDKGSSAKRSNSAPSPTFNICFTNS